MSNRRSPSKTWPTALPPIATSMTSCTSATLRPRRAISARLQLNRQQRAGRWSARPWCRPRPAPTASTASMLVADLGQHLDVVAEHLDGDVAAHAGDQLVEPHLDRLDELVVVAGISGSSSLQLLDEVGLGPLRIGPLARAASASRRCRRRSAASGSVAISAVPIFEKT